METKSPLQTFLDEFRSRFEPALASFLAQQETNLLQIDILGGLAGDVLAEFAKNGGKRIRPALVQIGYLAGGGPKEDNRILLPAIAMELFHAFMLIHDDIMDRSDLRRGKKTVHRVFEEMYGQYFGSLAEQKTHFGESLALLVGDLCCAHAHRALTESDFLPDRVILALRKLHTMMDETVVGQILDVTYPVLGLSNEDQVTKIHLLKTAGYTFRGPLQLGMILAGANAKQIEAIEKYASSVGTAFQIKDDILGVFGTSKEVGKSVTSDLEEGKETLLTVFARRHACNKNRDRLNYILGRRGLTSEEHLEAQKIFESTGALSYSEKRAEELVQFAKSSLDHLCLPETIYSYLSELADNMIHRTS